ncbi:hypothetical protein RCL1_005278 [Eukaryota sp. TZLM3-RCL]
MDKEADNIILTALRSINAPISTLNSITDVTSSILVSVVSHCLQAINPGLTDLPTGLPDDLPMTSKFKACTKLSNHIKELNFMGDIGYQTFLYPVPKDVRVLLRWLVESIPKTAATSLGPSSSLLSSVHQSVNTFYHQHTPFFSDCKHRQYRRFPFGSSYYSLPTFSEEPLEVLDKTTIIDDSNLLDVFIKQLTGNSSRHSSSSGRLALANFAEEDAVVTSVSTIKTSSDDSIEEVQAEISSLEQELETLKQDVKSVELRLETAQNSLLTVQKEHESLEKSVERAKLIISMLDDVDGNQLKLNNQISEKSSDLSTLQSKVNAVLDHLTQEKEGLLASKQSIIDTHENLTNTYKEKRKSSKNLASLVQNLQEEVQILKQSNQDQEVVIGPKKTRSYYIDRIRDAQKTVKKQRDEISKVLLDVKASDKDLAATFAQLQTEFNEVEGQLFNFAKTQGKKDPLFNTLYQNLAEVHQAFTRTATVVEQLGNVLAEIREAELGLNSEQSTLAALDVSSVERDLKQVKEENSKLKKERKAAMLAQ